MKKTENDEAMALTKALRALYKALNLQPRFEASRSSVKGPMMTEMNVE